MESRSVLTNIRPAKTCFKVIRVYTQGFQSRTLHLGKGPKSTSGSIPLGMPSIHSVATALPPNRLQQTELRAVVEAMLPDSPLSQVQPRLTSLSFR